jgi:hypothetical protein
MVIFILWREPDVCPKGFDLQVLVSRSGLKPATSARFRYPSTLLPMPELPDAEAGKIHFARQNTQDKFPLATTLLDPTRNISMN